MIFVNDCYRLANFQLTGLRRRIEAIHGLARWLLVLIVVT